MFSAHIEMIIWSLSLYDDPSHWFLYRPWAILALQNYNPLYCDFWFLYWTIGFGLLIIFCCGFFFILVLHDWSVDFLGHLWLCPQLFHSFLLLSFCSKVSFAISLIWGNSSLAMNQTNRIFFGILLKLTQYFFFLFY